MIRMVLPLLMALAACRAFAGEPQQQSYSLTTDTPQYCAQLARQVGEHRGNGAEVSHLLAEGRDMCGRGQVRGGILRLRRALIILHHHLAQ